MAKKKRRSSRSGASCYLGWDTETFLEQLENFLGGQLTEDEANSFEDHVLHCDVCGKNYAVFRLLATAPPALFEIAHETAKMNRAKEKRIRRQGAKKKGKRGRKKRGG